jgi:hypothetical protein
MAKPIAEDAEAPEEKIKKLSLPSGVLPVGGVNRPTVWLAYH